MKREPTSDAAGPERLRTLLQRRTAEVAEEAVQQDGRVPPVELDQLERLARVVELCGDEAPRTRQRWPMAAVVVGTLVLVSLLLFTRVTETEIELDATLEEMAFSSPAPQVLSDVMNLTSLGVSGLEEIGIPRSGSLPARRFQGPAGAPAAIHLSLAPDGEESSISLAGVALPAGARVRLEPSDTGRRARLSLEGAAQELRADVYGEIRIGLAGEGVQVLEFSTPRSIFLRSGADRVDLELGLAGGGPMALANQLLAVDLVLSRVEEFFGSERTLVRQVSTVRSGALYFESLDGEARPLRSGERLRFEESRGEIRALDLAEGHLELEFHGRVRGMATGTDEHPRSLMPTSLDWLRARHGLGLLWGTTLYLTGIVAGLLRWWRVST